MPSYHASAVWMPAAVALVLSLSITPDRAAAQGEAVCAVINCDCASISAGILTKQWRKDCQVCETRLREVCSQNAPPLFNGLRKSGVCEQKCSVYGDNAYPKAPASPKAPRPGEAAPASGAGPMDLLSCPPAMRLATEAVDGMKFTGCLRADGRRVGLWLFVDKDRKKVVEIVYVDGVEISRKEYAL